MSSNNMHEDEIVAKTPNITQTISSEHSNNIIANTVSRQSIKTI